ncbi:hypothetical protein V8G54_005036 [Vigna mungo]|uniref:Uncharacterized protein n=1 Tax=Vigna mungo TaxID=3915 RepID=A0AAQ3SDM4_VIGMU
MLLLLTNRIIGWLKFSTWNRYNSRSIDQRASHNSQRLYPRTGEWLNCAFFIISTEKGNVPYVVDNGAGVFTRSPKKTTKMVAEWFTTKSNELKKMSEKALKLAQPEAVFDILREGEGKGKVGLGGERKSKVGLRSAKAATFFLENRHGQEINTCSKQKTGTRSLPFSIAMRTNPHLALRKAI